MLVVVALAACSGPADSDGGERPSTPAYVYEGDEQPVVVDPDVMETELQSLVDEVRTMNARPVLDSWRAVRGMGSPGCPNDRVVETPENGVHTYFDGLCLAEGDLAFKGPMSVWDLTDNPLDQWEVADPRPWLVFDGTLWTGQAMRGQTDVYSRDGAVDFNCSCTAIDLFGSNPDGRFEWLTYIDGPTHWTGHEDDGTWMDRGDQLNVFERISRHTMTGELRAKIGADATRAGAVYGNVSLELDLVRSPDAGACTGHARVEMRHTETARRVSFTMDVAGERCEACAAVEGGDVCVAFDPIFAFEDHPW